jgi:predicted HicB family RNase H-like nuclease
MRIAVSLSASMDSHAGAWEPVKLKTAFEEAVIDYLEACDLVGKTPQKPYSGKLMLRIRPEIHAAVATAAELSGQSINQWASDVLNREACL